MKKILKLIVILTTLPMSTLASSQPAELNLDQLLAYSLENHNNYYVDEATAVIVIEGVFIIDPSVLSPDHKQFLKDLAETLHWTSSDGVQYDMSKAMVIVVEDPDTNRSQLPPEIQAMLKDPTNKQQRPCRELMDFKNERLRVDPWNFF